MTQIEKLKSRLATASPAEAKLIRELIQTLSASDATPDPAPDTAQRDVQDTAPVISQFCRDKAAAKMWADLASGKAKATVRESPARRIDE